MALKFHGRNTFSTLKLYSDVAEKSSLLSSKVREEGNQLLRQKNHSENIHEEILLKYSKSVALAPYPSEELVLALGNRSYLLKHLGKYYECISDIDFAMQFNIMSDSLKVKLLCRKLICLVLLKKKFQANQIYIQIKNVCSKLSDKSQKDRCLKIANETIKSNYKSESLKKKVTCGIDFIKILPFSSDAISMYYDVKRGRHLIANRDISTGEILLVEKPFFYPNLEKMYIICTHCSKQMWNSVPCEHCAFSSFCSSICKKEAWEKYHDIECSLYSKLLTEKVAIQYLFVWRLFIIALKEKDAEIIIQEAANCNVGIQTPSGNEKI